MNVWFALSRYESNKQFGHVIIAGQSFIRGAFPNGQHPQQHLTDNQYNHSTSIQREVGAVLAANDCASRPLQKTAASAANMAQTFCYAPPRNGIDSASHMAAKKFAEDLLVTDYHFLLLEYQWLAFIARTRALCSAILARAHHVKRRHLRHLIDASANACPCRLNVRI
jgi:hypothetical protein